MIGVIKVLFWQLGNILLYVPKQVGERITSKNIEMSRNVVYFPGIEPTQAVLFMVWFVTMIYLKT